MELIKIRTRICDLLGIKYPIIEGGMGEKQGVNSTVAISNAGGLGCVRQSPFVILGEDPRETMLRELNEAKRLTDKAFAVNIRLSREEMGYDDSRGLLEMVLEERRKDAELARRLKAIVTSAGDTTPYVERIKSEGLVHIHKVTALAQAKRVERAGVDALIVMGQAAAGHIGSAHIDGIVLFPLIAESVKIPVIASGGICDGHSFVAALALGAEGVEIGTRFMSSKEADFNPNVKSEVVKARVEDTLTGVGWFSTVRVYRNKYAVEYEKSAKGMKEEELKVVDPKLKEELATEFFRRIKVQQIEEGDMENCILPLGQIAGRIREVLSIEEIFSKILRESIEIVRDLGDKVTEPEG